MTEDPKPSRRALLSDWLIRAGLEGSRQDALLESYCQKLVELGLPLCRVHVAQRAYHPRYGGIGFDWWRDGPVSQEQYERSAVPSEAWVVSPMYHLLAQRAKEIRERLETQDAASRFPVLNDLKAAGVTDYFATRMLFEALDPDVVIDPNDPPEGALISWASDRAGGFSDSDIDLLRSTLPHLALALKSASNHRMARALLAVYLGEDAGKRVLSGAIQRGSLQQIHAVICYFDLTGFTVLAEQLSGPALIEMVNDYFEIAVSEIERHGGNVLKFMGDGLLAIFDLDRVPGARSATLEAALAVSRRMQDRNAERAASGQPTTGFTMALHAGDVLYGNIGSENRLDFTVIGPAVNLTARISGMHRAVGRDIILSEEVASGRIAGTAELVSLGRYMLRGVSRPLELFTIYDDGATT